jgi:chitinase
MITYDNPEVLRQKAQYISDKSLGGAVFWETSADAAGAQGVIGTTVGSLGHNLEQSTNLLEYPQSQYHNIASGNV